MTVDLAAIEDQLSSIHPSTLEFIPNSSNVMNTPNLSLTSFDLKQTKEHLSRLRYFFHEHKTKSIFLEKLMDQDYWNQLTGSSPLSMVDLKSLESQIEPLKNTVKKSKENTESLTSRLNELCDGLVDDNDNLIRDYNHAVSIVGDIHTAKEQIHRLGQSLFSSTDFSFHYQQQKYGSASSTSAMMTTGLIEEEMQKEFKGEIESILEADNDEDQVRKELDEICINTERKRAAIEQLRAINKELEKLLDHHNIELKRLVTKKDEQEEELRVLTRQRRLSWTEERRRLEWLTEWYQSLKEWREEFSGVKVELDGDVLTITLESLDNKTNKTLRFEICEKSGKVTMIDEMGERRKKELTEDLCSYLVKYKFQSLL